MAKKFNGEFTEVTLSGEKIFIILPMTFMNRSGSSISAVSAFYKIDPDEILVIHDELELDFGVVGFKQGGGLGGHNGLRSITSSLGTRDFNRFRIGISRPEHKDVTSYVLGNFSKEEQKELSFLLESGADILEENIKIDFDDLDMKLRKIRIF